MSLVSHNGVIREATAKEQTEIDARQSQAVSDRPTEKLAKIRTIRNQLLQDTDWKVTMAKEKGTTLTSSFKTWRQGLRDIPSTYTTESEYDELLARDDDGNLTHSVWSE